MQSLIVHPLIQALSEERTETRSRADRAAHAIHRLRTSAGLR